MAVRQIVKYLEYISKLSMAGLLVIACAASKPQVSPAPNDLKNARQALNAAKQKSRQQCLATLGALSQGENRYLLRFALDELTYAKQKGKAERCPAKFRMLEKQYLEALALFYSCQDTNAADLARYVICEVNSLKCPNTKPVARFTAPSEAKINDLYNF